MGEVVATPCGSVAGQGMFAGMLNLLQTSNEDPFQQVHILNWPQEKLRNGDWFDTIDRHRVLVHMFCGFVGMSRVPCSVF